MAKYPEKKHKHMYNGERGYKCVGWIHFRQFGDQWKDFVSAVINHV
jgi:hypothetical protein